MLIIFSISFLLSAHGALKRPAFAWSTYTHAAISAEALSKYPALMPEAVYSSSLPDITTNFISPASKDKFYSVFHGENFQKASVALLSKLDKKSGRLMISNIYGFLSHIAADKIAHTSESYANTKKTFSVKTELDHYTAYLFMDMLCYYDYFYGYNSKFGKFVADVDFSLIEAALGEYNAINGENAPMQLSRSEFMKKETAFKAGITIQKAIFDILIDENPELFEQARSFYSDYYLGINGCGGFYDAAAAVEEKISNGDYSQISSGGLKIFINRQINDITYAAMQFTSLIARDTEFIRTSKLSSAGIVSLVSKFFESKSASTKAMGRFLSALLLKKGLTYEQIIDYTDGVAAAANKESEKFKKYKTAYKKLKEPRWYSFIPGTDSKEKCEYIDAFVDYQKEKNETEIKDAGLSGPAAGAFRDAENKRLSTYREAYLSSKLKPLDYISKKAACDAAFTNAGIVKSYIKGKSQAAASGSVKLSRALDLKAAAFIDKNLKAQKIAAGRGISYKLLNPLKTLYEKQHILHASLNNADINKIIAGFNGTAKDNAAGAPVIFSPEDLQNDRAYASYLENKGAAGNPAGVTTDINNALKLMQNSYKKYIETLNACDINEISGEGVRAELDKLLKNYIRHKTNYEKLYYNSGADARD